MVTLILSILNLAVRVLNWALWIYVILSWFPPRSMTLFRVRDFLAQFIEPLLSPIRNLMAPLTYRIGLDFSPYVLILLISFVYRLLARIIMIGLI